MLLAAAGIACAQEIDGSVKDDEGRILAGASAVLRRGRDSAVMRMSLSDDSGRYRFNIVGKGKYFVEVSHAGFISARSAVFETGATGDKEIPGIRLGKAVKTLNAAQVTTQKPLIEVRADRLIVNVEGSINATGLDALELLRRSPGVLVDKDENIGLNGKNGVRIYIDGRPSPLSNRDLSNYLKSLPSASIESIEIITNPSAKYDAAGNAGIINIRLQKNKAFGTNATINAGFSEGVFPKYNGGITVNHRNARVNLFGNYNYSDRRNESYINLYRKQLDTLFDQHTTVISPGRSHNFKAGADYFIDKLSTIGFMVTGSFARNETNSKSRTPISYIPTDEPVKVLVAGNQGRSTRDNADLNLNYRYAGPKGHEFNLDADYGLYRIRGKQYQPNFYYAADGGRPYDSSIYEMIAPTDIHIATLKGDYEQGSKNEKFGVGFKLSYVRSENNFQRYNVLGGNDVQDTLGSNRFNYTENINAAYINYNRNLKRFSLQVGVRMENTNARGISYGEKWDGKYESYDSGFNRNYTDFFPSASLTFNKNPKNQLSLTYSRRIDRPSYQDLNPFEFRIDAYTFQKGNTLLTPQYTNSFGIVHSFRYKLITTLNYSHVRDIFTQLIDTIDLSKTFLTKRNLATQDVLSLNFSYSYLHKGYSLFANLNSFYSHYRANLGPGRTISLGTPSLNVYIQNFIKFNKFYSGELTGFYTAPSILQGTFKMRSMWGIDVGGQRNVFNGNGTVKVSVSDIFRTMPWRGSSNFAGQQLLANGGWESRLLKLSFLYRVGNNKVKATRQRKASSEDESKRVGTQGEGLNKP